MGGLGEEINVGGRVVIGGTRFGDFLLTEEGQKAVSRMLEPSIINDGLPVTFVGLFNNGKWLKPFYASLKYTRLMDKDKGPFIPYAGNVGMYFTSGLAVDKLFSKIESLFEKSVFTGMVEISCLVYEEEIRVIELKPFFTPLFFNFVELLVPKLSEYLLKQNEDDIDFRFGKVSMGVQLTLPYPVQGCVNISSQAEKHFWAVSNDDPVIGWSTAWGKDLVESYRRTYRTIRNIVLKPEVQFREDIGFKKVNAEDLFFILKEWGWIDATIRRKVQESIQLERKRVSGEVQEDREDR
jgi:hypothetical protein